MVTQMHTFNATQMDSFQVPFARCLHPCHQLLAAYAGIDHTSHSMLKVRLSIEERKSKQMFVYRNAIRCVFLVTHACGWFNTYKKAMRNTWCVWKDGCLIFVASLKIFYYYGFCTVFIGLSTRNIGIVFLSFTLFNKWYHSFYQVQMWISFSIRFHLGCSFWNIKLIEYIYWFCDFFLHFISCSFMINRAWTTKKPWCPKCKTHNQGKLIKWLNSHCSIFTSVIIAKLNYTHMKHTKWVNTKYKHLYDTQTNDFVEKRVNLPNALTVECPNKKKVPQ